ncbi:hypothetical protein BG006_010989 [Podila minutissima]|uniref:N-acetyltransferase domain-containing protein n=1 Tax=Podila minutissima TaxID=64525 RepID=A0A9P5SF31_9FUNG|nr:hypothetical protein BG006_010989 [Podila minutissima]
MTIDPIPPPTRNIGPYKVAEDLYLSASTFRTLQRCTASSISTSPSPSACPVIGLLYLGDLDHEEDGLAICYRPPSAGSNAGGEQGGDLMRCGVLGYWLSPEFAGKDVMTRVVAYALRVLAGPVFGHERVHGIAWEENAPSNRVMERAGMVRAPSYPLYVLKFKVIKTCSHYTFDIVKS